MQSLGNDWVSNVVFKQWHQQEPATRPMRLIQESMLDGID